MNAKHRLASMTLALIAGCNAPEPKLEGELPDIDLDACPGATLVGILDSRDGDCDLGGAVPDGWYSLRLFTGGPMPEDEVPGELARFCVFKREIGSGEYGREEYEDMLRAIDAAPMMDVDTVALSCAVQQAQVGLADSPEVQAAAREAFRSNVARVDADVLAASESARVPVDLALLDTVPRLPGDAPAPILNEHGLQMWELATDIACPSGDSACLDHVVQVLALPRETPESSPIWDSGGKYGSQTDVALAIFAAVTGWEQHKGSPDEAARLVINLSLGWEVADLDSLDPNRGPVAAVRTALDYAACRGALVFAAAGNNRIAECPDAHTGLLYPAAFESFVAPDAAACEALGFETDETAELPVFGAERPLVVAVGGVDELDVPLINSRVQGQPALVALGANGIAAGEAGSAAALTGTSVSTAVASAAAALVWSYRPDLRPDELVELLYTAGWDTGASASAGRRVGEDVRRLSVCASLDVACEGLPADQCPELDCPATAPASDGNLGDYFQAIDDTLASETVAELTLAEPGESPTCEDDDTDILAQPQPEVPVCPYCNVEIPPDNEPMALAKLNMSVSADYVGTISAVKFVTYDSLRVATTFALDAAIVDSLNDPTTTITSVALSAPGTVSATLIFTLEDPTGLQTQSNPIAVYQL